MEVILLKHVENLGSRGEIVHVQPGFARNYLLPRRVAVRATPGAKRLVEQEARKFQKQDAAAHTDAKSISERLASAVLKIEVKADEEGKLYGSVGTQEISESLAKQDFQISRKQILLEHPLKLLGEYEVAIKLHHDVRGALKVTIVQE